MKDKEAREAIVSLVLKLGKISIKDCPKCEHPVLVRELVSRKLRGYQCLTCGSMLTCTEKCVCELVKDV